MEMWADVNDRGLGWTLPQEFTAAEERAFAPNPAIWVLSLLR